MRLLNSSTRQLQVFPSNAIPPYAVLSHTWSEEEVEFADLDRPTAQGKAGYKKLRWGCQQAFADGLEYVWMDTCCIDKSSSAELSEAINSMFSWYQRAKICYAYLADVPAGEDLKTVDSAFSRSRWFTRGWTLQELIAPSELVFYVESKGETWAELGRKSDWSGLLVDITGIDLDILEGTESLEHMSIAKRMSWASHRQTTRPEDLAYCLMGIFSVNMPMMYGEGEKAFIRLQEEIMRYSDDQSLFAWTSPAAVKGSYHGLLATSPADFAASGHIVPYRRWLAGTPFSMSNRGLGIDLPLFPSDSMEHTHFATLDCPAPDHQRKVAILLKRLSPNGDQYARINPHRFCYLLGEAKSERVYVRQSTLLPNDRDIYPLRHCRLGMIDFTEEYEFVELRVTLSLAYGIRLRHYMKSSWSPGDEPFDFHIEEGGDQLAVVLVLRRIGKEETIFILLGSTDRSGVGFDAVLAASSLTQPNPQTTAMESTPNMKKLAASFAPRASGSTICLQGRCNVRMSTESHRRSVTEYFLINLHVEPETRQAPVHARTWTTPSQQDRSLNEVSSTSTPESSPVSRSNSTSSHTRILVGNDRKPKSRSAFRKGYNVSYSDHIPRPEP